MKTLEGKWALVLGASSGFGAAISRELSQAGMNIIGVHLDRKSTLSQVKALIEELESQGSQTLFKNMNASDCDKRASLIEEIKALGINQITTLVHSLAFGSLKPFLGEKGQRITRDQINMTLDVMAHSFVYWTQDLFDAGLLSEGSSLFAMTSSGSTRVWHSYGAVSAAKAALESHTRQLSLELGKHQVAVNAIRAGVTDTPALRKIPGNEEMIAMAKGRNPQGRLTTPEDIARIVTLLSQSGAHWMTGNVLGVDGGEDIVG